MRRDFANLYIVVFNRHRVKQLCFCILHTLILLAITLSQTGCYHIMGSVMSKAPNAGKTVVELSESNFKTPISHGVNYKLRVDVGPPKASLSVWVVEPKYQIPENRYISAPKGTIVILHGYRDTKESLAYLTWATKFAENGYRSVLVDLRGHGHSTGDWLTYGVVESRDISQLITALSKRGLLAGKVGVFGRSYGAAVAIQTAAIDRRISTVVAIEAFRSMHEMIPHFSRKAMGPFAFVCITSKKQWKKGFSSAGQIAGYDTYNASAFEAVKKTKTPIMFIHANNDQMVPSWHSRTMYDQTTGPSKLLIFANENHKSLGVYNIDHLQYDILTWFNLWM